MWHHLIRQLLAGLRIIPKPDLVGRIMDRHPTPAELKTGVFIIVRDDNRQKWACFRCPGGCGEKLQLPLRPSKRPRWAVTLDWLRRPSVTPSVHQLNNCRCHFWLKGGTVEWCASNKYQSDPTAQHLPRC